MSIDYDSILADFVIEANELLDRAESSVLDLEKGYQKELVDQIFRTVHTIKGNAGLFDLSRISKLAHTLENVLNLVRNGELDIKMNVIDDVLISLDRLREMIRNIKDSESYEIDDLLQKLSKFTSKKDEPKKEAAPAQTPSPMTIVPVTAAPVAPPAAERVEAKKDEPVEAAPEKDIEKNVLNEKVKTEVALNVNRPEVKSTLKIPAKLLNTAVETKQTLSFVYINLLNQDEKTLHAVLQKLKPVFDTKSVLMHGLYEDKIPMLKDTWQFVPYYLILLTQESAAMLLDRANVRYEKIRVLYEPEKSGVAKTTDTPQVKEIVQESKVVSEPVAVKVKEEIQEKEVANATTKVTEEIQDSKENEVKVAEQIEVIPESGIQKEQISSSVAAIIPQATPENREHETAEANIMEQNITSESYPTSDKREDAPHIPQKSGENVSDTHLKVPVKLIDTLINLAGETVIARNEMMQKIDHFSDPALEMVGKRVSYLVTRLQEGIMRTRLQELNTVFQRLPRVVRDASQNTGKKVELVVEGGDVELDKTLIDAMGESIMHMIRNAVDHGLESPAERLRVGKKEAGIVKVVAQLRGGNVFLSIKDDGRGLNIEKIKSSAVAKGLITKDAASIMTHQEAVELVFMAGLSTADKVTQTSGRGVGMDVVRSNFKKLGGTVDIISEMGHGTTITATLPQTLTIVTCLLIRSSNMLFALPQQNVVELILVDRTQMTSVENHPMYNLRGRLLPILGLSSTLKLSESDSNKEEFIAVVTSERHHFGLLIDEIVNMEEIVVKRLGEHFSGLSFFSGAAIMGDGEAVLILDVPGLAKFSNLQANTNEEALLKEERARSEADQNILSGYLLFSVDKQKFAVPVQSIPRIEKIDNNQIEYFMGLEVVKYRGDVVPIVRLEEFYELEMKQKAIYLIIFTIEGMRIGITATQVYNVVNRLPEIKVGRFEGRSITGHTILNNETTLVLDVIDFLKHLRESRFEEIIEYNKNLREDAREATRAEVVTPSIEEIKYYPKPDAEKRSVHSDVSRTEQIRSSRREEEESAQVGSAPIAETFRAPSSPAGNGSTQHKEDEGKVIGGVWKKVEVKEQK